MNTKELEKELSLYSSPYSSKSLLTEKSVQLPEKSIQTVLFFCEAKALSEKRGMKISKAATRLGASPIEAKAISIADKIIFFSSEEDMVAAVKKYGQSCMSKTPDSYRYWARASCNGYSDIFAVAVYKNTRALVRTDNRTFVKAYGEQHSEMLSALEILGYEQNPEEFSRGLDMPSSIEGECSLLSYREEYLPQVYKFEYFRSGEFRQISVTKKEMKGMGIKYNAFLGRYFSPCFNNGQEFELLGVEQPKKKIKKYKKGLIKKPYHDGIHCFL